MSGRLVDPPAHRWLSSGNAEEPNSVYARPAGLASLGSNTHLAEPYRIRAPHCVYIGSGVSIAGGSVLSVVDEFQGTKYGGILRIGDECDIGPDFYVHCAGEVTIGSRVSIGARVFVCDSSRDGSDRGNSGVDLDIGEADPIQICEGAVVGIGAMVMPGVTIGECARVDAGAVVTRDVPPGAIARGNPARVVRSDRAAGDWRGWG